MDAATGYISPEDLQRRDEGGLLEESSLLVFKVWMQLGGPTSPPTPQEVADMDAPLAMDIAWLLRAYRRAAEAEKSTFAMFDPADKRVVGSEWPHGFELE